MTVLAAAGFAVLIPIVFALACPLMMILMMRGMHGMHGHGRASGRDRTQEASLEELYRRRDELEQEISEHEQTRTLPAASARADLKEAR
jgi:cell division protein FtsB